ncbi:MAG: methyltransferase domain-containing protein [Alphaproteobacteria bacterium]|nr:methyltransferase domain-containing protein [Alphaproteobacteria bacterium]
MAHNGACRLCGASDFEVVQREALDLAGVGATALSYGVCLSCALLQQIDSASPEQRERHYRFFASDSGPAGNATPVGTPAPHTQRMMEMLREYLPAARSVFEIGAAAGHALYCLREAGYRVGGCDPSRLAAQQAAHVFGIEVLPAGLADALPHMAGFDALYLSHLLEHLTEPLAALKLIRGAVKRGTGLVLEVPCAVAPEDLPPGWFTFEHVSYFTEATLTRALGRAGFRVLHTRVRRGVFLYPVIAAVAIAHDAEEPSASDAERASAIAFARAVAARDAAIWAETARRLDRLEGPVVVWGAGVHSSQLLAHATGPWQDALIGFVDRDSQKWGARLGRHFIQPPKIITPDATGPSIVISSFASETQIAADLAALGVPESRIVRLYDGREIAKAA